MIRIGKQICFTIPDLNIGVVDFKGIGNIMSGEAEDTGSEDFEDIPEFVDVPESDVSE